MKMFDTVTIVCDHTLQEDAAALRAVLEAFRIRVNDVRLVQRTQAATFFASRQPGEYTVLYCHGDGEGDGMRARLEVVGQENDDPTAPTGWAPETFSLTPARIPQICTGAHGTLLSIACGSGREPLARAFLGAGYSAYVAPTEEYYDGDADLAFAVSFFYHLLSNDRDYDGRNLSARESAGRAARLDSDLKVETRAMRYYDASDFPDPVSRGAQAATRPIISP